MKGLAFGPAFFVSRELSQRQSNQERHPGQRRDPSWPAAIRTQEHLLTDSWVPAFAGMTSFEIYRRPLRLRCPFSNPTMLPMDIFKIFTLEAAHRLPNVPPGHKCARLHGHSFRIEVRVSGEPGADTGWVMDFGDIKAAFQPIHDQLDHHYLNEIEGLENPTSERLAIWIWERLKPLLPALSEIVIHETCTSGCRYRA